MKYLVLILILVLAGCYDEKTIDNGGGEKVQLNLIMETDNQIVYMIMDADDVKKFKNTILKNNYSIQSFASNHGTVFITVNKPAKEPEAISIKQRALSKLTDDEKTALNLK